MKILGYGYCPLDIYHETGLSFPLSIDRLGKPVLEDGGGNAANTLCLLGVLGHEVYFLGRIGTDKASETIIKSFHFHCVKTDYLIQGKGRTRHCHCLVDSNGQRKFLIDNKNGVPELEPGEAMVLIPEPSIFDLYITELPTQVSHYFAERIPLVAYNGQIYHGTQIERDFLEKSHIFVASEAYIRAFLKLRIDESIKKAHLESIPHITLCIVTLGEKGVVGIYHGDYFSIPSINVDVVDTTGAGDALMGAVLHLFLNNRDPNTKHLIDMIHRGIEVACRVCEGYGARYGLSNLKFQFPDIPGTVPRNPRSG